MLFAKRCLFDAFRVESENLLYYVDLWFLGGNFNYTQRAFHYIFLYWCFTILGSDFEMSEIQFHEIQSQKNFIRKYKIPTKFLCFYNLKKIGRSDSENLIIRIIEKPAISNFVYFRQYQKSQRATIFHFSSSKNRFLNLTPTETGKFSYHPNWYVQFQLRV
jgi:hypothetical protein